jgi:hypothetical protein
MLSVQLFSMLLSIFISDLIHCFKRKFEKNYQWLFFDKEIDIRAQSGVSRTVIG